MNNNNDINNNNNENDSKTLKEVINEFESSRRWPTSATVHYPVLTLHCLHCNHMTYVSDNTAKRMFAKGKVLVNCTGCKKTLYVESKNETWDIHPTFLNLDKAIEEESDEPYVFWKDTQEVLNPVYAKVDLRKSSTSIPKYEPAAVEEEDDGEKIEDGSISPEETLEDIEINLQYLDELSNDLDLLLKAHKEHNKLQRKMIKYLCPLS